MGIGHLFERGVKAIAVLGIACLGLAAFMTIADVALRRSMGISVAGLVDLTQLMMMYAVYFGVVYAFTQRSHVAVTILTERLSKRHQRYVAAFWWIVGLGVVAFLAYAAGTQAFAQLEYGDLSQTIGIPMIFYWIPVVLGLALSVPASLFAVSRELSRQ